MSPALYLYLAFTSASAPLAWLALKWRLAAGKEDADRMSERMGRPSADRPTGALIWCHAASVGEGLSLLPLIDRFRAELPHVSVLVTSGTVTSATLLASRLPEGALHQFVPLDVRPAVDRFLDHWRPDVAVWIESEIWPRLLTSVEARRIPALLLNARLSARSRARWRKAPGAAVHLFSIFEEIQAQDQQTASTLLELGIPAERLQIAGSFKNAAPPLPCDEKELARLAEGVRDRFVWVAASTHPGEEELVVEAHRKIVEVRPNALLILVPRHPERGDSIAAELDAAGLTWARRTPDRTCPGRVSVYLADTIGELGLWYRLSEVAFVAGSMTDVGGHNPYEPVALGVPILHGPDTANFADIYADLDTAGGARSVGSAQELAQAVLDLSTGTEGAVLSSRATKVVNSDSDALGRAVQLVLARLPRP